MARIRGLAKLDKNNPRKVVWNQYVPGWDRPRHRTQTFPSESLARKFCEQHDAKMTLGLIGEVVPITFEDAAREYLCSLGFLADGTKRLYAQTLGMFGRMVAQGVTVSEINGTHIDRFQALRRAGNRRRKGVEESTLAGDIRDLSAFFIWCLEKRNYHDRNPLKQASRLPARKHRRNAPIMTIELIESIIQNLDTDDRRVACAFAAMRPIDRSVITRLHPAQVNLAERRLEFRRPKTARRAAVTIIMPIPPVLVPEFQSRCLQTPAGLPLFHGLARSNQRGPRDWWSRAVSAAGCPDLWFRDLRKFASSYLQTVAPAAMVQHYLGHAEGDGSVMGGYYTQLMPELVARIESLRVPGFPSRHPELKIATA